VKSSFAATFLVAGLLITSAGSAPAWAGKADDTLNAAFSGEVTTLDAYRETTREGLVVARLLHDSLLSKDFDTGEFKPELAVSYSFVDDKTVDFQLRQGVRFHNGAAFTADDVVHTLNTVSAKEYGARYRSAVDWIESAEKLGEHAVRIRMKTANPLALEMLAGNLPIYPKGYHEEVGSKGMGSKPVGAGPYRLVEMTPGVRFVFERFDGYYEGSPKGQPSIRRIIIRTLPEANTQYAELMNGGLDWIWRVPPDDARNLERRPNLEVKSAELMRFGYININPKALGGSTPVADLRVRQAINHAIDREAIVKALVGGASKAIHTACNPIQFGCDQQVQRYPYDIARAKALLADAGYPNGFEIDLTSASFPRVHAEAIIASLAKAGIRARLNDQQSAPAKTAWREGRVPLYLAHWGSYGIGDAGLSTSEYFGGTDDDLVRDPNVLPLLQAAGSTVDRDLRKKNFSTALKTIAAQAYWAPLWTYSVITAQNKDLELKLQADEYVEFFKARWK
jgi:peptide/nickel transport system substrate-binding protein